MLGYPAINLVAEPGRLAIYGPSTTRGTVEEGARVRLTQLALVDMEPGPGP